MTRVFISGTTVAQALSFLGVQANMRGSGFCIPRAAKLVRAPEGWSMEPMSQSERWIWGIPMDLNRCSRKDILLLPGIGPSTAALIHGYLLDRVWVASPVELDGIRGLGPRRMEAVRRYLEVEGERPSRPGKGPDRQERGPRP